MVAINATAWLASSDLYGYYSLKLKSYILESHYEQEKLKAILGKKLQKSSL